MNKADKRRILHLLTRYVLFKRGHAIPDGYDIEWDPMEPESQYSMIYEDMEYVFEALEKYRIQLLPKK